ncbi:MAG: hypothetical protein FWF01_03975 [Alphaproteobacteria bacterium]|nr:hypothetical protein [Alphaproteobacteria bacterium]
MKKVINWIGVVFFIMAVLSIYTQLGRHSMADIKAAMLAIPGRNLAYALAACVMGYVVLAMYDRLALRYIGRTLEPWKWLLAGFLGFAISNNAGTAVVSGAAIRYHLYTRWKFRMNEIFKMIIFSGFTYLVGCLFLVVAGSFLIPQDMRSSATVTLAFWPCLVVLVGYFAMAAFYKRELRVGEYSMKMPTVGTATMQAALGMCDSLLASLVLYSVLYPLVQVPFNIYVGVFVISQVLGVFTPVPGALGVFEGLFLFLLPDARGNEAAVFGALIAYRVIYFLIPLIVTSIIILLVLPYMRFRKGQHIPAWIRRRGYTRLLSS